MHTVFKLIVESVILQHCCMVKITPFHKVFIFFVAENKHFMHNRYYVPY